MNEYPNLSSVLDFSDETGFKITSQNIYDKKITKYSNHLKYYYVDENTEKIIANNVKWAMGKSDKPEFQFAYVMLPTKCNQKCIGCFMGQDKPQTLKIKSKAFFNKYEIDCIAGFLKDHGAGTIIYGGEGELFTWSGAFEYIKYLYKLEIKSVIFTNGSLLTNQQISLLNDCEATIIVSLRDTSEYYHNKIVGGNFFRKSLNTIDIAMSLKMELDNRLAVEIPVTKNNEKKILKDFIPAMRYLGIVPMVEEFIPSAKTINSACIPHNFDESRIFFNRTSQEDSMRGIEWKPESGTRIIGQPKCNRALYSFTIFPCRTVADCPVNSKEFGNLFLNTLEEIVYSDAFKKSILEFRSCNCSVCYSVEKVREKSIFNL
jgi:MoaA/NifB/PqqE/SkfB family radical SAM enzyme